MARYTAGESMNQLPIAFLHNGTLKGLRKRMETHTSLQSMRMKVWQLGPLPPLGCSPLLSNEDTPCSFRPILEALGALRLWPG
jgi:hypothetical protein